MFWNLHVLELLRCVQLRFVTLRHVTFTLSCFKLPLNFHINKWKTFFLPTGIGERYSQTISIIWLVAPSRPCELPPLAECWTNSVGQAFISLRLPLRGNTPTPANMTRNNYLLSSPSLVCRNTGSHAQCLCQVAWLNPGLHWCRHSFHLHSCLSPCGQTQRRYRHLYFP
jgi:hypothetical protein